MIKFPDGFFYGSATSATQIEGKFSGDGSGASIWDYWYESEPKKFHNNIGPSTTSSFYLNYKDDIKLLKKTGHNSFRTSISWSRLFPEGHGKINEKAVKFYKDLFKSLKDNGIEPFVNLYHFDMPKSLQDIGGFENRKVVDYFREYAKTCFELFSDYVKYWFTFNEPIVHVECGYLLKCHYPNKYSPKLAVQVAYHTALCNAFAIKEYKKLKLDGEIGIILNLTPAYPRSDSKEDLKAAKIAELFQSKSFLDVSVYGEFNKELLDILKKEELIPEYKKEDLKVLKENIIDFLGVNYYQPLRVKSPENISESSNIFDKYFSPYEMPGRKMNEHRGWEIYEKGLYDISINIRDNYGNIKWLVTENGMGVAGEEEFKVDGVIQDDYRIDFMKEHLKWLYKGIKEGSNCKGYQVWTFIDCWSWLNSYKNRYGLIELDYDTQKRNIKKSGYWFKKLSDMNGF